MSKIDSNIPPIPMLGPALNWKKKKKVQPLVKTALSYEVHEVHLPFIILLNIMRCFSSEKRHPKKK